MVPYFQPIISVEGRSVVAFEALGRHLLDGGVHSLGPFFQSSQNDPDSVEFRRGIDRILRASALLRFSREAHSSQRLFLNVNPRFMVDHLNRRSSELPWTLQAIQETGLDPRRVVIELTEESVGTETSSLRRLVDEYRAFGCSIAVDDVGAEASNLDRIGYFEPDIIKIDALLLRRSLQERAFEEVLAGLRTIADGLGASLLFEGVETEREFDQALRFGARYLQGWFLAPAGAGFLAPETFSAFLGPHLRRFGAQREAHIVDRDRTLGLIISLLSASFPEISEENGVTLVDPRSLEPWSHLACRVFLTDRQGFQVSPNYDAVPGGWRRDDAVWGSCRSARPYFAGTGTPNRGGSRLWSVSDAYFDANDRRRIRTFGRQIGSDLVLFVDVPEVEKPTRNR